ncbi:hypothetical protein FE633_13090 [Streptomyces montanus]|uniref:HEPN domain-containing protein n=1 Tax=Streptomyces montanus TaxID=2580423 RepID=A0A5R9FWG2_9ACTN|nr:hypothetical protein [Streptomyces montanus]TLS45698.1 hypothetical protein FE633_13090 [Streptomyces montanus]
MTELETDAEIAFAFRTAADLVAEHWYDDRADDSLALVVLYNYRHALELGLKAALRTLVDSITFEVNPGDQPPAVVEKIGKELARTHQLGVLADYLVQLAPMFRMHIQGDVRSLCDEVHALDPDGQALRYSMVKVKGGTTSPARPDPLYVDVPEFARRAGEACTALDILLDQITNVQDWQVNIGPDYMRRQP